MEFKNKDVFKNYIRSEALRLGLSIPNTYATFFSRTLLQHLSEYKFDDIVIKGSFAQYIHLKKLSRAIRDVDIASHLNYDILKEILKETLKISNKQVKYTLTDKNKVTTNNIRQISVIGSFEDIKQTIGMDILFQRPCSLGCKLNVVPPIFKQDENFIVYTLSCEEHLAEKLCILAENSFNEPFNLRLKDFYDVYQLHGGIYDPDTLSKYFKILLKTRNRVALENVNTEHLNSSFIRKHQEIWDRSLSTFGIIDQDADFTKIVYYSRAVLREQIQKAKTEQKEIRKFCLSKKTQRKFR